MAYQIKMQMPTLPKDLDFDQGLAWFTDGFGRVLAADVFKLIFDDRLNHQIGDRWSITFWIEK